MSCFALLARKLSVLWVSLFALCLAACGPSPDSVVQDFYKAVADNRADDAISYLLLEDVKENDLSDVKEKIQGMFINILHKRIEAGGGLESVDVTVVEKKGDAAKVHAEVKYKNGTDEGGDFDLVKNAKGEWKIKLGK